MHYHEVLSTIKAFAFDVDGVLSNGQLLAMPDGDALRLFNAKDGYAIVKALNSGYPVAIITGAISESVKIRYEYLGVKDLYMGRLDKLPALLDFCEKHHLSPSQVAYGGDDIPDIPAIQAAGLGFCPADAVREVKECALYVSPVAGGNAVVRDVIEQVLKIQQKWYSTNK